MENNLRDLRKSEGLTLRQVEALTNINKAHLSEIENGVRRPTYDERMSLNKLYDDKVKWWHKVPADPDL